MRLWLTLGLGLGLDLASKYLGWHWLGGVPEAGGRDVVVIPGWLRFVASENPGIVFGIDFSADVGLPGWAAWALTVLLTVATSAFIFYVFATSLPRHRLMHVWCGLILAGALGNLFDRLVYGYVRDLIQITGELTLAGRTLSWPFVFNVADVYLVVGVIAVAATILFFPHPDGTGRKPESSRRES